MALRDCVALEASKTETLLTLRVAGDKCVLLRDKASGELTVENRSDLRVTLEQTRRVLAEAKRLGLVD